jgi:hypothetical protein
MAVSDFTIGQMRSSVVFMSNTPIPNDSGGRDDNWNATLTTRGRLRKDTGRKLNEQGEVIFNKDYELILRYQAAIVIDSKGKVVVNSVDYRIKDFTKIDEINHIYRLILSKNE